MTITVELTKNELGILMMGLRGLLMDSSVRCPCSPAHLAGERLEMKLFDVQRKAEADQLTNQQKGS